jgi:hypothetical protein
VPTLAEYRTWTDQNLRLARAAQTESERRFYLNLAGTYLGEVVRLDSAKALPPAGTLSLTTETTASTPSRPERKGR